MRYYLVFVHDDIEPDLMGPFPSEELRDDKAIDIREEFGKDHGIYALDIDGPGKPTIAPYPGKFFMEQKEK